jgi:hypothetical protein
VFQADVCRRSAISLFAKATGSDEKFATGVDAEALLLEFCRRIGQFDGVVTLCMEGLAWQPAQLHPTARRARSGRIGRISRSLVWGLGYRPSKRSSARDNRRR